MEHEDIAQQIAHLARQLQETVGDLDAQIAALQMQRNVLAAPLEEQLHYWRDLLTQHYASSGAGKTSLKMEAFTYTFYWSEVVDREMLKALVVELPQVGQCLGQKAMGRLRLR